MYMLASLKCPVVPRPRPSWLQWRPRDRHPNSFLNVRCCRSNLCAIPSPQLLDILDLVKYCERANPPAMSHSSIPAFIKRTFFNKDRLFESPLEKRTPGKIATRSLPLSPPRVAEQTIPSRLAIFPPYLAA
ncbi:hypothetical protein J3459_017531 [Metarhizium acridum]|nr:hypothetical protein J3459_017531 [Metarhizium acridum]